MFFTQEDYKKIQTWLNQNAIKDSEFKEASLPLNEYDIISFVQNGNNVKVRLKDFLEQLFLLREFSDFINVTDKYKAKYILLKQAIQLVPYKTRKIGQVITFLNEEKEWKIYQFKGESVNQWNEESLWEDIVKAIQGSDLVADEEDLTEVVDEVSGKSLLKLKDKTYDPDNFSGLGRVILRKNIVTVLNPDTQEGQDINLLTQQMINKPNTIYEIQYDFDLNDQEITIPEGCVLDFKGGSLSNGNIKGNNTYIKNKNMCCFSSSTVLGGTWNAELAYSNWFSFKNDCILDVNKKFISGTNNEQMLHNILLFNNIIFNEGIYYFEGNFNLKNGQTINGNNATFKFKYKNKYSSALNINKLENVILTNLTIIGWKQESNDTTQHSHGISIIGSNNIYINNIHSLYFLGDGIYVGYSDDIISKNIILSNVINKYNYRQGLSITGVDVMSVENSEFSYTSGTLPQAGIDIEPNNNEICTNIVFNNIKCINNIGNAFLFSGNDNNNINNITINNIYIVNNNNNIGISIRKCKNCTISNFEIKANDGYGIVFNDSIIKNINIINGKIIGNSQTKTGLFWSNITESKNIILSNIEIAGFGNYGLQLVDNSKIDNFVLKDLFVHNCYHNISIFGNEVINVRVQNVRTSNVGLDLNNIKYPNWTFGHDRRIQTDIKTLINYDNIVSGASEDRPILNESYLGFQFFDTTIKKIIYWNTSYWVDSNGNSVNSLKQGTTQQRPTDVKAGFYYFDTTLNKPIWKKDDTTNVWIDAMGAKV